MAVCREKLRRFLFYLDFACYERQVEAQEHAGFLTMFQFDRKVVETGWESREEVVR